MPGRRLVFSTVALPVVWLVATFAGITLFEPARTDDGALRPECGRHLTGPAGEIVPVIESVRVVLATDEEWREAMPGPPGSEARHTLLDAASLFRGIGIHLLAVRLVDWVSPDDAATIRDVWMAARETISSADGDVVVVLSGQEYATEQDGYATVGGNYVAVAHHPGREELDALVLAHEISHLFGAHHGCDVPGREGLMASKGFDHDLICPCTRRILELNANRFHGQRQ